MNPTIDLTKFNLKYACKVHDLMDCPFCGLTEEQLEKKISEIEGNVNYSGEDGSQNYINLMGQEDCEVLGGTNDFKMDVNESEMCEVKLANNNLLEISENNTDILNQLLRILNDPEEFEKPHESTINFADLCGNSSGEDVFLNYFNSMEQGDQKREDAFQNCRNSMEQGVCEQDYEKRDKYTCLTSTVSEISNVVGTNFAGANKIKSSGEEYTPASNLHFSAKSVKVFNKTVSEIVGDIELYSVVENCNHSKLHYPPQFQKTKIKPKINFDEILIVEIGEDIQAPSAAENSSRIKVHYPLQFQQPKFKPEFNPNEILEAQIQNGTSENLFETRSQSLNQIKLGTKRPASELSESCGVKRVKTNDLCSDSSPSVLRNRVSKSPLIQKKNCSVKDPIRSELDQFLYAKSRASLSEDEARRGSATLKSMVYNHFNFDNVCNNLCNSSLRDVKNAIKRQGQLLLNLGNIFFSPCFGQNLKGG